MKIRSGFVSNSSSSSFTVYLKDLGSHKSANLSDDQLDALAQNGFTTDKYYATFDASCNQDEVAKFLIENKIPFKASCHYDHYHLFWNGKSDKVIMIQNPGKIVETYGFEWNLWEVFGRPWEKEIYRELPLTYFTEEE